MAAKIGLAECNVGAGVVLCATTQMEHEADSVLLGWWCVDSATAAHTISDRQIHVKTLPENLIGPGC